MTGTPSFFALTPERVLAAVEASGLRCTGLCYPLNSFENRVYELEYEDRTRVIAKFYRPGRWSAEAIGEEHGFLHALREADLPVVAPLPFPDGTTLREAPGTDILYTLFPKAGGRSPEEFSDEHLERLGTLLARIHTVGAAERSVHRPAITAERYLRDSLDALVSLGSLPVALQTPFRGVTDALLDLATEALGPLPTHRIHGDCHPGNLLWGTAGAFFLDFDDMGEGPAVQDFWMLIPGRDAEALRQRDVMVAAYGRFRDFDRRGLEAIELLRAMRYLHYAAWIARRWRDPAFPRAFPHFGTDRYWKDLLADLHEQLRLLGAQAPAGAPSPAPSVEVREIAWRSPEFQRIAALRDLVLGALYDLEEEALTDPDDATGTHWLAVASDGRALGAARASAPDARGFVSVDFLVVRQESLRAGVGTALLRAVEAAARAADACGLATESPLAALPFYAAQDFVASAPARLRGAVTVRPMLREWAPPR